MKFDADNPRFVWLVGAVHETFPDLPDLPPSAGLVMWDRQEKQAVAKLTPNYAQLICLETTREPGHSPLTDLEAWLNGMQPGDLSSEGIPDTHETKLLKLTCESRFETSCTIEVPVGVSEASVLEALTDQGSTSLREYLGENHGLNEAVAEANISTCMYTVTPASLPAEQHCPLTETTTEILNDSLVTTPPTDI
jgi:hypothetical protein